MRKKVLFSKPVNYAPLITAEAAVVTLAVHAVLFFATGYQPEKRNLPNTGESSITLLNLDAPQEGMKSLKQWLAVHDPAQFSRSDGSAGYMAYLQAPVLRDYTGARPRLAVTLPEERLPGYKPLRPLRREDGGFSEELRCIPQKRMAETARPRKPLVFDADHRPLSLSRLAVPVGRGAKLPTVVQCRKTGSVMRLTLISGSGDAGLDSRALQALARSGDELPEESTEVTVYWPETAGEESEK